MTRRSRPAPLTFPGVFIEEIPPGHTIEGVPTSTAAFVGRAWRGPVDQPTRISSFAEFERLFGGLWGDAPMSYAIEQRSRMAPARRSSCA